jgi:hypothetical protein
MCLKTTSVLEKQYIKVTGYNHSTDIDITVKMLGFIIQLLYCMRNTTSMV